MSEAVEHERRIQCSQAGGRQATAKDGDSLLIQEKRGWTTVRHMNSDNMALTSHFDSGKVSPGFSSPAALAEVSGWGSGGGMGMGIGRGMG